MAKQLQKNSIKLNSNSKNSYNLKHKKIVVGLTNLRQIAHTYSRKSFSDRKDSIKSILRVKDRAQKITKATNLLVADNLKCPICLDLIIKPMRTNCGHWYCLGCADSAIPSQGICCVCRQSVDEDSFKIQKTMEAIFKKIVCFKLTQEQRLSYQQRQKQYQEFQNRKKIPEDISVGDLVDLRIKKVWKEGIILEATKQIVVVACKKNQEIKFMLQKTSRNIAKFRTFTLAQSQPISAKSVINIQSGELHRAQYVLSQDNIDNEVFWQLPTIDEDLQNDRWMLEESDNIANLNDQQWAVIF